MRSDLLAAAFALLSAPVWADCPAGADHAAALETLIAKAQGAQSEAEGRALGQQMWQIWATAPDEAAQAILDRGMRQRESYDFAGAVLTFSKLIAYCPAYAEGYNQRAFARFLQQDFAAAVPDLERALALQPRHVAARAGLALTYMNIGEIERARDVLRVALAQNPWLAERHLLGPGGPLAPQGRDL